MSVPREHGHGEPRRVDGAPGPVHVSACVITRDEEAELPECLASIAFCDEIIVVDSGSTDATLAIARAAGARVIEHPWLGFAAQRNVGLEHARGDWVLEIDADERVTPALRKEIQAFLAAPPSGVDLAALPRREVLVGHALGGAAKFPNYCHRLFLRGAYRHDESRTVHEGIVPAGPVHPFTGELTHRFAATWREAVDDARRYARLEVAQMTAAPTAPGVAAGVVLRPLAKLAYRLVVDAGWRDGLPGLAKITIDCATDAAVWIQHARAGGTPVQPRSPAGTGGDRHYGSRRWPRGNVRSALVACGSGAADQAADWGRGAALRGQDVVVITDRADRVQGVRVRHLAGPGPLSILRALDVEEQLRTIDAVVPFGTRAQLISRLLPPNLAGRISARVRNETPAGLERRVELARRVWAT